jgi:DNA polymerase-1
VKVLEARSQRKLDDMVGSCRKLQEEGLSRAFRNITQNIPNPENDRFKIRKAFIAEPGKKTKLIVSDYEALEMRLLACASLEPKMVEMIRAGRDIHMGNAAMVFGPVDGFTYEDIATAKKMHGRYTKGEVPEEAVTEQMHLLLKRRKQVKTIGFGLNYGMKEKKLAHDLDITPDEALEIMDMYMDTYPAVRGFFEEAVAETQECGYAWTILGRRRFLGNILSENEMDRWGDERKATNSPIQGSAADVVKMAMIKCHYEGNLYYRFGCKMLLQVHDELMFECPEETTKEASAVIKELMEHSLPTDLAVPLTTSMGIGTNWSDTH